MQASNLMEETKEFHSSSKQFTNEVAAIYQLIIDYHYRFNSNGDLPKGRFESLFIKAIVLAVILLGGLIAALQFLPLSTWGDTSEKIRFSLQLFAVVSFTIGGFIAILGYFSVKEVFNDMAGQIIKLTAKANEEEAELFESLDKFSTPAITYVANRFEEMELQLGRLKSFIIGSIEKVGVIPGLLASVFALSQISSNSGFSWLELLSIALLVIYFCMFPITGAAIRIKRMSKLLNAYLTLVRAKPESPE